jgi:putative spermidine/putrescine transport system substrate-binding protein
MVNATISRRRLLALGGAGLAGAALSACGQGEIQQSGASGGGGNGKVTVTMFVFLGGDLGVMPKAFAKEYMASHPNVELKIYENSNQVGYPKMLATKQATPDKPFVNLGFFNAQISAQGDTDDMWQPLDYAAMPNAADITDLFRRPGQRGIGVGTDQIGVVYSPQAIGTAPDSWTAVWDDRYRDKLSMFDYWWYAVLAAARLNGGSENNMEPGWDLWRQKAGNIRAIVTSNPEWQQVLSNGTSTITSCWHGTGLQFKRNGAPIEYAPPAEGAIAVPVYLQSVKGNTPQQQEVCQDVINEMLAPKWALEWARTSIQLPANPGVKLPADMADLPGFRKSTVDKLVSVDWSVAAAQNADWKKRWDSDVKANI